MFGGRIAEATAGRIDGPRLARTAAMLTVASPLDVVQAALKSGNGEMYREAVALFKELDGLAARKAFDKAMADAKGEIQVIRKNETVGSDHKSCHRCIPATAFGCGSFIFRSALPTIFHQGNIRCARF
jgi:hypothetical protein